MEQLAKANLKKKLKIPLTRLSAYTGILGQVITLNIADYITLPSEFGRGDSGIILSVCTDFSHTKC
ncbi:unnamed protein product [Brassica oleracea var. botrytis]